MKSIYGDNLYQIRVVDGGSLDGYSGAGDITSGCLVIVRDAGTKTESTIYSSPARAAQANPITRAQYATEGKIQFYGAATSYDIMVAHEDGSVGYFTVTPTTHVVRLDRSGSEKCIVVPLVFNDNVETDTGVDMPLDSLIYDARLYVKTTDATETINLGLLSSESSGDADGLLAGVSLANAGYPALVAYTVGSNETYVSSNLYGALIASGSVGNDVATDVGSVFTKGHIVTGSNAKSISYTCSAGTDTFAGYGFIFFRKLR